MHVQVLALLCVISEPFNSRAPGARRAAYAALTQQAMRQHGQELQLVRLVSATFRAVSGLGRRNERAGTLTLGMDVRHFGAPQPAHGDAAHHAARGVRGATTSA